MVRRLLWLFTILPAFVMAQVAPLVPPPVAAPTLPPLPNPVITDPSTLLSVYENAALGWYQRVYPYALELFAALAFLEVAAFGWRLWRIYNGDIRTAILETTNKVLVIGVFLSILLNGLTWAQDIIGMFETVGKNASGIPSLTPSAILAQGFNIFGAMLGNTSAIGAIGSIPTTLALLAAAVLVFISFLVITFQFVITKIQTFLALGLGFFFLAFGGSSWTTPYVERYFAYCVASGAKLMSLYALIGIGWVVTADWVRQAGQVGLFQSGVEAAFKIAGGAILFAGICWWGSSQISQVLGGSPNMSHSDFLSFMGPMIAGAVAASTAGAALLTGPVGAAGAAGATTAASVGASAGGGTGAAAAASTAASGGGGASAGLRAMAQFANAGASTINRMPHGGSQTQPPHFSGFGH